jgi:hypothetical protein
MASLHLHRTYRWLTAIWMLSIVRTLVLLPFNPGSRAYLDLWLWTQPVLWVAEICVVAEVYSLVLRSHRGIYSVARYFLYGAVGLGAVTAILLIQPGRASGSGILKLQIYDLFLRATSGVRAGSGVFLLLLLVCLQWYPVRLSRNLVLYAVTYSCSYLAGGTLLFYLNQVGRLAAPAVSIPLMVVSILGTLAWCVLLSRQGESTPAPIFRPRPEQQREQLIRRLDTLNTTLLGVGKRIN